MRESPYLPPASASRVPALGYPLQVYLIRRTGTQPKGLEELLFRIAAVLLFNLPKAALSEAVALLPGLKSPPVLPLVEADWSAVHTVVEASRFWKVAHQLQKLGAQGILGMDIEKLIR